MSYEYNYLFVCALMVAALLFACAPLVISAEGFTPAQDDEELERVLRAVVAAVKGQGT